MARDRPHVGLVQAFLDREGWDADIADETSRATLLTAEKRAADRSAVVVVPTSETPATVDHVKSAYDVASRRGADSAFVAADELTDDARSTLRSSAVQRLALEDLEGAEATAQSTGGTPETRAVSRRRLAVVGAGVIGAGVVGSMVLPSGDGTDGGGDATAGTTDPSTPTATDTSRSQSETETTAADNTQTASTDTGTTASTPESTATPQSTATSESTATPATTVTTVEVVLTSAPDGLQKYSLRLSTSGEGTIGDVTPELISGNQFQVTDGGVGASAVAVRGADLVGSAGETSEPETLLTVSLESPIPAAAVAGSVTELVDDNGESFSTDRVAFRTE